MNARRRAILWDVGGTLVDFACSLSESVRGRLAACGVDHSRLSDERIEKTYNDFIADEQQWRLIEHERAAETRWLEALLQSETLRTDAISQIAARMPRYFGLYQPVSGMIQLLCELREQGLAMAIVSNWPPSLPEFLQHHDLAQYFNPIVYSAQNGMHKPDPRIFENALNALDAIPQEALFIGDNFALDIVPARLLGMPAIHFDPRRKQDASDAQEVAALRPLIWEFLER
jgi:HAD superfamily hydrolase (TIGR01549 family)